MPLWTPFKLGVEAVFLLIHAVILYCIIREKQLKDGKFSSAFFTFYVLQSIFDVVLILSYGITHGLAQLGVELSFYHIVLGLGTHAKLGQAVAHVFIALNRYTALVFPHLNNKFWTRRRVVSGRVLSRLLPLPSLVFKLQVEYKIVTDPVSGGFVARSTVSYFTTVNSGINLAFSVLAALISAGFEARTFVFYFKLGKSARRTYRDDYKLLLYAILQLAGQMLSAVCSLSVIIAIFENTGYLLSIIASVWAVTVDILGLSGPICLLMTR
ncbi:hypothetical protein AAVH_17039 [Aphelenchoides avenae]|nr:hypothetical protein AAVH_17039 [Aphelenchus avenae]